MKRWTPAVLALALARDLDRDLDRARAQNLDRDLDRDLARVLDSADALTRALTDAQALTDALALVNALAQALTRARELACARTRGRNLIRALVRARNRARALDRSLYAAVWSAGGAASIPGRLPLGMVELVVRMLPEHERQRAREELCGELVELSRRNQLRHALGVLAHTWELRRALTEAARPLDGAPACRVKR